MVTLPDSSTSSSLVCNDGKVLLSLMSSTSLDTTFLGSIVFFFDVSTDTCHLYVDLSVSKSSSRHESLVDVDEIKLSSSPITPPFFFTPVLSGLHTYRTLQKVRFYSSTIK